MSVDGTAMLGFHHCCCCRYILVCLTIVCCFKVTLGVWYVGDCNIEENERIALRNQVKELFRFGMDCYLKAAFPKDNLSPLSCKGEDSMGGLLVTLIDNLDTLLIFEEYDLFKTYVKEVESRLVMEVNSSVSIFETTIRVLGGLLSSHVLLTEAANIIELPTDYFLEYNGCLLRLARQLADRFMPAFNTLTGIPFGSIHLQHGVNEQESLVASTAGAGSLLLEFGTLSRLTGDPNLFQKASPRGLLGNHIEIVNGRWIANASGIGGSIDSFYEYLLKGFALFGDYELLKIFQLCYKSIHEHLFKDPWYMDCDMSKGTITSFIQSSLSAFFPSLEVLHGDLKVAIKSHRAFYSIWRKYGMLPEGFDLLHGRPAVRQRNYPLRPELFESNFYIHWSTQDPSWLSIVRNAIWSLENITKVNCGFCSVKDVLRRELEDAMESFFLSETCKYLYLTLVPNHWIYSGKFIFSTEAHPFLIPPAFYSSDFQEPVSSLRCARPSALRNVEKCGFG
eukprot:jgi/Galph1/4223/GphlegSOOS_G2928.1